jgi:hypothetical protein
MIINCILGDIYTTKAKHIVFAVSTQGYSDTESPDQIARLWPELANSGRLQLGEIFSQQHEDKMYYALVVFSPDIDGWAQTPEHLEKCLNNLNVGEPIAIVLMGNSMVGRSMGADVHSILLAMERSEKQLIVYSNLEEIPWVVQRGRQMPAW